MNNKNDDFTIFDDFPFDENNENKNDDIEELTKDNISAEINDDNKLSDETSSFIKPPQNGDDTINQNIFKHPIHFENCEIFKEDHVHVDFNLTGREIFTVTIHL